MGFFIFNLRSSTILLFPLLRFPLAFSDNELRNTTPPDIKNGPIYTNSSQLIPAALEASPLQPGIIVLVSLLAALFSITLLLLLYAKHCKGGGLNGGNQGVYTHRGPMFVRKNSGIDRAVIETLPLFRFGSLRGEKDGLECAVCLNVYEPTEVLRLLPKCKHAFHVECVDVWLDAHSTCPLCRYQVNPEDVLLIEEPKILNKNEVVADEEPYTDPIENQNDIVLEIESESQGVTGRHSSVGERTTHHSGNNDVVGGLFSMSFRRSFDNMKTKQLNNRYQLDTTSDGPRRDILLLKFSSNNSNNVLSTKNKAALLLENTPNSSKSNHRISCDRRLEHQIIVGMGQHSIHGVQFQRQSLSDLLYLRSEMIISDSRRFSSNKQGQQRKRHGERSVSEIKRLRRFASSNNSRNFRNSNSREEEHTWSESRRGLSRWMSLISPSTSGASRSHSQPVAQLDHAIIQLQLRSSM